MLTGTFPKTGSGTVEDPKDHPDWYSGPDAIAANDVATLKRRISETPTTVTVEYSKRFLRDGDDELLRRRIKNSALFDDAMWAAMSGTEKADFVRTVCQNIVRRLLKGVL